jgi:hypothetical protein
MKLVIVVKPEKLRPQRFLRQSAAKKTRIVIVPLRSAQVAFLEI